MKESKFSYLPYKAINNYIAHNLAFGIEYFLLQGSVLGSMRERGKWSFC